MSTRSKKAQTKTKEPRFKGFKSWDDVTKDTILDAAIERGERLEKITKIVERLFKGCQCAFCKGSFKNTAALKRILKLAKGA